jgi:hypothetical protein
MAKSNNNEINEKLEVLRKKLSKIEGLSKANLEDLIKNVPYAGKAALTERIKKLELNKEVADLVAKNFGTAYFNKADKMDRMALSMVKNILNGSYGTQRLFARMLNVVAKLATDAPMSPADEVVAATFQSQPTAARVFLRLLKESKKDKALLSNIERALGQTEKKMLDSNTPLNEDKMLDNLFDWKGKFDYLAFQVADDNVPVPQPLQRDGTNNENNPPPAANPTDGNQPDKPKNEGEKTERTITFDGDKVTITTTTTGTRRDSEDGTRTPGGPGETIPNKDPDFDPRMIFRYDKDGHGYAISIHTIECTDVYGTFISDLFDDQLDYVFDGDVEFNKAIFPVVVASKRPRGDVNEGDVLSDMRTLCKEDDEKSEHLLIHDETRLVNRLAYLGMPGLSVKRQDSKNSSFNLDEFVELDGYIHLFESNKEVKRIIREIFDALRKIARVAAKVAAKFTGGDFMEFILREANDETIADIGELIQKAIDENQEIGVANFTITNDHIVKAFAGGPIQLYQGTFEYVTGYDEQDEEVGDEGSRGLYVVSLRYERYSRGPKPVGH